MAVGPGIDTPSIGTQGTIVLSEIEFRIHFKVDTYIIILSLLQNDTFHFTYPYMGHI